MAEEILRRQVGRTPPAQWLIAISLSVIAVCLLVEVTASRSQADVETGVGAGGSLFAVAGKVTSGSYGIYLVDAQKGTMCVYEWLPNVRKLRLMAGRNFTFDLRLDEYNTEPLPREIKKLVERSRRLPAGPASGK